MIIIMNLLFPNKTNDPVLYAEREMKSNLATGDPVICRTPFHYSWSKKSKKGSGKGKGKGGGG